MDDCQSGCFPGNRLLMNNMIVVMFCTLNIYYLAFIKYEGILIVSNYISEHYFFVVVHNAGYLKRFAGL